MNTTNPRKTSRRAAAKSSAPPEPKKKPGRRTTRRKKKVSSADDMVILAMSPNAANVLRVVLARSRHEEPELRAIQAELEDWLGGLPPRK